MKIFMIKSLCIAALMFISVLAGMQIANDGIHKIMGKNDSNSEHQRSIQNGNNHMQESVSDQESSSHDLLSKQQKLEKMNSFNLFSSMGKKLSEGISNTSEKIIESLMK